MERQAPELRVTLRCCIEDLGLSREEAANPTEIDHDLVRKFLQLRSQDPEGTEKVQPLDNASEVYTLHAGRWRGATWHDRTNDVVWLLGGGVHRSGEHDDAYPKFKQLDSADRLLPTQADYELFFEAEDRSFSEALMEEAPRLLEEAREARPDEVRCLLAGKVPVSVAVLREESIEAVYLAVSMKLERDGLQPPSDWFEALWAAFFPWINDPLTDLSVEEAIAGRDVAADEIVYAALREVD